MISLIKGQVVKNNGVKIVLLTSGGVGYEIAVSPARISKWTKGEEVEILTYLIVREDVMDLYGFETEEEKKLFLHFISVSGIGPKSGLHLLSLGTVSEIKGAIGRSDVEYLTKVSGVGRKTAERIVVELKNKMDVLEGADTGAGNVNEELGEVVDGLVALGYSLPEARSVIKTLDVKGKSTEEILKQALQSIK